MNDIIVHATVQFLQFSLQLLYTNTARWGGRCRVQCYHEKDAFPLV